MLNICGVVVLYNPDNSILDNIQSYISCIDKLYVIDNSDDINCEIAEAIQNIHKCIYISNNGNHGIAQALNVGVNKAIANRSDWVLTMDQDSRFEKGGGVSQSF